MTRERAIQASYFLLRIVAALLFMEPGAMKLFGWFGGMPGGGVAQFPSQIWFAGVLEVFGGFLILIGLFTRPVAFVLSGEMAVAYWQAHAPHGFWPILNHGEPAILFCFIWLFMAAYGGGAWSLDAWLRSRRFSHTSASPNP
jgi:putative oxidoreductase